MRPLARDRAASRGFTLIELMVAAAIVGLLSSVAVPGYMRMVLRSRAAERVSVMTAVGQAIQTVVQTQQQVPGSTWTGTSWQGTWLGNWNPVGAPQPYKRRFDWTLPGWKDLPMVVEGDTYYSYYFLATDSGGVTTLDVQGVGDLDGDGVVSAVDYYYVASGYSFAAPIVTPPAGQENATTF